MAVPKKKTSSSKTKKRRSHHALKAVNVAVDATTGEFKLPHHISLVDGYYKGRKVIKVRSDTAADTPQS